MSPGHFADARAIARAVRTRSASAVEVVKAHLDRIDSLNPVLNAYTDVTADRALAQAAEIDARVAAGQPVGVLAGVPFAVKNLFDIEGLPTRAGSAINRERAPAHSDGELVRRLLAADAVLLGGLNMGEYAYDFTGENVHDGNCANPHDTAHMAGGSSSGSGSAVAAGLCAIALGSDTNGSIRVPSSFNGIFGLKPTYGRLTRHGSFPFVDSLDHLGPFARNAADLALAYDLMQGPDPRDGGMANRPVEAVGETLDKGIGGLRVAIAGGWFDTTAFPDAAKAVAMAAKGLGAAATVDVPGAEAGRAAAFVITNAESARFHLGRLKTRADDFDPDTRDRFLAGAMIPAGWLVRAQQVRKWYLEQVMELFRSVDLLIAPSTPFTAPRIGQKTVEIRGEDVLARPNIGLFTQPVSCIGLPVAAVPVACGTRLPIGVQLIAAPWREDLVLRAARHLESEGIAFAPRPAI
ncbi:MAG: AtzE family amidohydrolase [Pseudomonadota bacterium]|nr:AtzE family amidohydrolase [Pseudomonadota bacterium]